MNTLSRLPHRSRLLSWRALTILAFLIVVLARGGWMITHLPELRNDTDSYVLLATNLARHGVFGKAVSPGDAEIIPTACRPPLYPVLLSLVANDNGEITPARTAVLNFALGLLTIAMVWAFVRKAAPDQPLVAVVSVLIIGLDPMLVFFSSQAMTETPAACLAAASCWLFALAIESNRLAPVFGLGAALGAATLTRTTFLPLLPLALVALLWFRSLSGRGGVERLLPGMRTALMLVLGAMLVLGPWMVRNHRIFGRPFVTTAHGGYALAVANSPDYLAYVANGGRQRGPWSLETFDARVGRDYPELSAYDSHGRNRPLGPHDELAMDSFLYRLAFEWIEADPRAFAYLAADRLVQFWNPVPHKSEPRESMAQFVVRMGFGAWHAICFLAAFTGLLVVGRRLEKSPWLWPAVICLVFTGIHLFFWTNLRMRAPVMPGIAAFASFGTVAIMRFIRAGLGKRSPQAQYAIATRLGEAEI